MSFFDKIMSLLKGGGKKRHSLDGEGEATGSHEEHIDISQESSGSESGDLRDDILSSLDRREKPKRIATSSEKKKKVMINNILVLGGIGVVFLVFALFQGKGRQEQPISANKKEEVVISLKDQALDDRTVYRKLMQDISKLTTNQEIILRQIKLNDERLSTLDNKFKESNASIYNLFNRMNTAIASLNKKIDNIGDRVERVNKRVDDVQNNVSVISSSQPVMVGGNTTGGAIPEAPKLVLPENSIETEIKKAKEALKKVISGDTDKKEDKQEKAPPKMTIKGGIYNNLSGSKNVAQNVYVNKHGEKVIKNIDPKKYSINREKGKVLPGFVKVVLLTGVAANTSNNAASNPMPVLMRVQGNLTMAGDAQYRMKSCFVLGSATGSVSDMRAHIRLANISCVDKENNRILEGPLKGYVVDSDGQFGLRGIYVERRADAIKKMFMSGFLQGLGSVIANAGNAASANGNNGSGINLGIAGQTSAAQGFTSALNKLVEFYMKEVQTMFPVIEVKSGRVATLVVTAPQILRWKDAKSDLVEKKVKNFTGR